MVKKKYNTKSSDAFGVTTGRLSMVRVGLALSFFVFTVAAGCVDNEQSFYIEHMKAPPDPPECTVSVGDKATPAVGLNLMLAAAPGSYFQVTNALISREDYGNLRAESNGIMIDGYEVYTIDPTQGIVGGTEYFDYNLYISPETTDLAYARIMSPAAITALAGNSCRYYAPSTVADAIFYTTVRDEASARGLILSQEDRDRATFGDSVIAGLSEFVNLPQTVYSMVRFLGHTQGGKEVETPEFTVPIFLSCGVVGGWTPCINDVCTAFCKDDAAVVESCDAGVNSAMTCSDYLAGSTYTVTYNQTDPNTNLTVREVDDVCEFFNCP